MTAAAEPAVERVTPPEALIRVANPALRALLGSPLHRPVSGSLLLLHVTGRRSGKANTVVVGYQRLDGVITTFTNSRWRLNLRGGADVEITLRGRRRPARATLVEDTGAVVAAYEEMIGRLGWKAAQRRLGVRINVGRVPTRDELAAAVRSSGLSIVSYELR